jgi:hypothetical protein
MPRRSSRIDRQIRALPLSVENVACSVSIKGPRANSQATPARGGSGVIECKCMGANATSAPERALTGVKHSRQGSAGFQFVGHNSHRLIDLGARASRTYSPRMAAQSRWRAGQSGGGSLGRLPRDSAIASRGGRGQGQSDAVTKCPLDDTTPLESTDRIAKRARQCDRRTEAWSWNGVAVDGGVLIAVDVE